MNALNFFLLRAPAIFFLLTLIREFDETLETQESLEFLGEGLNVHNDEGARSWNSRMAEGKLARRTMYILTLSSSSP